MSLQASPLFLNDLPAATLVPVKWITKIFIVTHFCERMTPAKVYAANVNSTVVAIGNPLDRSINMQCLRYK